MSESKSMPSPAALPPKDDPSRTIDMADLVERMASEMRVASGGELPLSFCVEQVKRKLAGKTSETAAANSAAVLSAKTAQTGGRSVFHSWAMPE
jgi:hypothetical protein